MSSYLITESGSILDCENGDRLTIVISVDTVSTVPALEYHPGISAPLMTGPIPVIKVTNYPAHMLEAMRREFVEKQVREDFELVQVLTKFLSR